MKKKYVAVAAGAVLALSLLGGCGGLKSSGGSAEDEGNLIYGEIIEIGDDVITVERGELIAENDKNSQGENSQDEDSGGSLGDWGSKDSSAGSGQEERSGGEVENPDAEGNAENPDAGDDTGESGAGGEAENPEAVSLSASTNGNSAASSEGQDANGGDSSGAGGDLSGGGAPDMSGDSSGGGAPDTGGDSSGGMPDMSGGDSSGESGGGMPGMVSEDSSGESGEMSGAGGDSSGGGASDMGGNSSGGGAPDMGGDSSGGGAPDTGGDSSGGMPDMGGDSSGGGMPGGNESSGESADDSSVIDLSGEEEEITVSDATAFYDAEGAESSIDALSEGDVISASLDALSGTAIEITLIWDADSADSQGGSGGMGGDMGGAPGGDMGGAPGGDMGGMGGSDASSINYEAVTEYSEDTEINGETYESTGADENAIHIFADAIVRLKDIVVSRISSSSSGGDNASFYGVGAAILNTDGVAYISGAQVDTDASGGAGIFSYGDGVTYVSDSTISTKQGASGGIHVAGGGTLYAWDLNVDTDGGSAAAIRSDRGSGTMVVDGGSYTSNGFGSPAIYSTADIIVHDADLTATGSEATCIEGLNSIRLFDCNLSGNMQDDSQNEVTWNVILYQSMSGDSDVGNSTFEMSGGSLTAGNGGMFYSTNTESTFILQDVDITYADENDFFLRVSGNQNARGWGTSGSNGADTKFLAIDQDMEGDVVWDSISNLDFYMTEGSSLRGAVVNDDSYAGGGGNGVCNVFIDKKSTWTVTGDCAVTNLYSSGSIVDEKGKKVSIVDSDGKVLVNGKSEYTITVSTYSDSVDTSGAPSATSWSDHEVEKPSELS